MKKIFLVAAFLAFPVLFTACKSKSEIRREQELENLKTQVKEAREGRADYDASFEEMRTEVARLSALVEQQAALNRSLSDDLTNKVNTMQARVQALEQRAVAEDLSLKQPAQVAEEKASFERGKRLFDSEKYEEAIDVLRQVASDGGEEGKKAQFLLGEACFANKDYASAALEFAQFRKAHPKDALVPNAIFRQASSFKNMGKAKEAKLFFQDLIERYPASPFTAKAKAEVKKLR